jgi:mono/diheme cytochrome c family protein
MIGRRVALTAALTALTVAGSARTQAQQADDIARGRYLAIAGDCTACHTNPAGGKPFAGGYAIASPLGVIYASNITPSRRYGVGAYSEAQFGRALRQGVRADGANLYPAMPYTAYAGLSDSDIHALYVYFMNAVPAVDAAAPVTHLPFPFNERWSMSVWNAMFLHDARFRPNPRRDATWNRGAYLAGALEHCSACHTPRNLLMAEDEGRAYAGGRVGPWYAPNITGDAVSGIGGWSRAELVRYLKTGAVPGKAQAAGGMAEAVTNSLQYLSDSDLNALAAYLQAIPPIRDEAGARPDSAWGGPAHFESALRGAPVVSRETGPELYSRYCASCHQPDGAGTRDGAYPALYHNTATGAPQPENLVAAILYGVRRDAGGAKVLMPSFGPGSYVQSLTDTQVAAIATYALATFGNPAAHVTPDDVAIARRGGPPSPLAQGAVALPIIMAAAVLLLVLAAVRFVRRGRRPRRRQGAWS